jgi:hypothetical protein
MNNHLTLKVKYLEAIFSKAVFNILYSSIALCDAKKVLFRGIVWNLWSVGKATHNDHFEFILWKVYYMRSQSSHNSEVQNFWKLLAIYFATTLVIF